MQHISRRSFLKAVPAVALSAAAAPPAWASVVAPVSAVPAPPQLPASWYIPDNPAARDLRQRYNLTCEVCCFRIIMLHYNMDAPEEQLQAILGSNENPEKGFRGEYWAPSSNGVQNYGAHALAINRLIDSFPQPGRFNGVPLADLTQAKAALAYNWLVIAWIPVGLEPSYTATITLSTGEQVHLVPAEHTIVLHGYDSSGFFTYDPRPSPRVSGYASADALARATALFDHPLLAVQPLF